MNDTIKIAVKTAFIAGQSNPAEHEFVYSYTISISNLGKEPVQLISRHWIIHDQDDAIQEVQGMGVVGEQPHIAPGDSFVYTSGVVLQTETGMMEGSYQMRGADGSRFDATIPTFALVPPHAIH
jgi:ApaG protein